MTDFEKWSKFDAESEEKAIDVEEKKVEISNKHAEKQAETRTIESEGVDVAESLAAKATAHARVAALRAKGSSRRRNNKGKESITSTPPTVLLDAQAEFLRGLSIELKSLIQERDKATELFKNGEVSESFSSFQQTLELVAATECKLPDIDEGAEDIEASSSDQMQVAVESMRRTVHMVRVDTLRGLGQCQLASNDTLAEASESFKAALLANSDDIASWLGRGECFLSMGLLTLAELHFVQAQSIIEKPKDKKKLKNKDKDKSIIKMIGNEDIDGSFKVSLDELRSRECPAVVRETKPNTIEACLLTANKYLKEASVCFKERFFWTSGLKYSGALTCLDEAHTLSRVGGIGSSSSSISSVRVGNHLGEAQPLRELRCSCHLNLAACFLQRARDYQLAVHHSSQVLDILKDTKNIQPETVVDFQQFRMKALLRRADAYAKLGKFDEGIVDLETALEASTKYADLDTAIDDITKRLEKIHYKKTLFAEITPGE